MPVTSASLKIWSNPGLWTLVHNNRRQTFEAREQLLSQAEFFRREAESDQNSLFGRDAPDAVPAFGLLKGLTGHRQTS